MNNFLRHVFLVAAVVLTATVRPPKVTADDCSHSCGRSHRVCRMQAVLAAKACLRGCGSDAAALQCKAGCYHTFRAARTACRASRADCTTNCPTAAAEADTCATGCGGDARGCFDDALSTGKTCVLGCTADTPTGLAGCLEDCASKVRRRGGACLATLQGCLSECQGTESGACFDTIAMQCTAESCGPEQACSQPNEFCSSRCGSVPPSGMCFDPTTKQCTQQTCSPTQPCAEANQTCVRECPPPRPHGTCFDTVTQQCMDEPCFPEVGCSVANQVCTLQCPRPPQCVSVPCGGRCIVSSPCPPGGPCPEVEDVLLGQCALDSAGSCQCAPPSPRPTRTPRPTPTPQCTGETCGGPCIISYPCAADGQCPDAPVRRGECASTTSGACECVPIELTPRPTPTPQCNSNACGGPCVIRSSCAGSEICPDAVIRGQCSAAADGSCQCVPGPTPTPACATDADCSDDNPCTADRCREGVCKHACLCLTEAGEQTCCPGPSALCVNPCGADAAGTCGGFCPLGAKCEASTISNAACACVSGPGGPCGGNVFAPPPVCAPALVCQRSAPDVTGYCEKADCVPLFASGCSETADCCKPCEDGTDAPCGVCVNGTCEGAP
jgi:hypothetical protein